MRRVGWSNGVEWDGEMEGSWLEEWRVVERDGRGENGRVARDGSGGGKETME